MAIQDDKHAIFTAWAQEQGVKINGVTPAQLPQRGVGIVATKQIKKDEQLVFIPSNALVTFDTDFVRDAGLKSDGTVYGTVAAALTLNDDNSAHAYKTWQSVWPSRADFESSMPLCWSPELRELLTPAAKAMLRHQETKYEADFAAVRERIPEQLWEWYRYYWMIVNTRCFYWEEFSKARREKKRGKRLARDECLALVPWGDYFNHAEQGCYVQESRDGFTIFSNRDYEKGEEVVSCYGAHSNDFLLVEYGFCLSANKHDTTSVDHIILKMLTASQIELLEQNNYLGDYYLNSEGFCYRTQVALRAMVTSSTRFEGFLLGEHDGSKEKAKYDRKYQTLVSTFAEEAESKIEVLEKMAARKDIGAGMLLLRWKQILALLENAERFDSDGE